MNIGISIKDLGDLLETIKINEKSIEVVYDHFKEPNHKPPFIVYTAPEAETYKASDIVFSQYNNYIVDLIVDKKNVELEEQLEQLFDDNYLPYDKEEQFIDSEKFYQIRYFI